VVWKALNEKPDGRFDKVPICRWSGHKISAMDKANHISFKEALDAHLSGVGDGLGISLTGESIAHNKAGEPLYLIGVDLDKVQESNKKLEAAKIVCKLIGSYCEVSPSGTGIRIFAFSKALFGNGQGVEGEMYHKGRFLTVTGHGTAREVVAATDQLKSIENQWWPEGVIKIHTDSLSHVSKANYPDTPRRRAQLEEILKYLSADCNYERYRDVVWAILSTNWHDAKVIAHNWCLTAPTRFNRDSFDLTVRSYNPHHTDIITIGSLLYWARKAGWRE
jgi:hypothetical protein